jgi:hypothetical protein
MACISLPICRLHRLLPMGDAEELVMHNAKPHDPDNKSESIELLLWRTSMSQRRIAVVIAGMLVGAQVGIAAIDGSSSATEEYAASTPVQAEATEQPAGGEQAPAGEQVAGAEQQPAAQIGYVVPAKPRTLADAAFPPLRSDVFPPSTDDQPLLPALVAYLDRKAASIELATAGAVGTVFPPSEEGAPMLPAQVAYFDRLEAARLAAAEVPVRTEVPMRAEVPLQQPSEERTPGTVGGIESSPPAGSGG